MIMDIVASRFCKYKVFTLYFMSSTQTLSMMMTTNPNYTVSVPLYTERFKRIFPAVFFSKTWASYSIKN